MTTTTTPTASVDDPTAPSVELGRGQQNVLLTLLLPATVMMYAVFQGVQQILLPAQVDAIDPANKVQNLAVITAFASVFAAIALPAGGAISDRTRGRFGRRTPWLVIAGLAATLVTALMGLATGIVVLGVAFSALWFTMNYFQAVITVLIPDRIPEHRRAFASSVIGISVPLGILVGVNIVAHVPQEVGYLIIAGLFLITTAALVLFAREPRFDGWGEPVATDGPRPSRNPVYVVGRFFKSFTTWDFSVAFISRFLIFLAYYSASGYMYFIVQDEIGAANVPGGDIAIGVSILSSINTITWVVAVPIMGLIADRLDRRKLIVGLCGLLLGVAFVVPILFPSFAGLVVYNVMAGAFFGSYMSLDIAIMSLVLPDKKNEGRDMGVLAVATAVPSVIAPLIAGGLILAFGGYDAAFVFGGIVAVLGGVAMMFIRRFR